MPVHLPSRLLLLFGVLVMLAGSGAAVAIADRDSDAIMAALLFGFGCYKGAIAVDVLLTRRRDPDATRTLEGHHGGRHAVTGWVIYKFAAMLAAFAASGYILTRITG